MLPASSHRYILVQETTCAYGRALSFTIMTHCWCKDTLLTTSGNTLLIVWFSDHSILISYLLGYSEHPTLGMHLAVVVTGIA